MESYDRLRLGRTWLIKRKKSYGAGSRCIAKDGRISYKLHWQWFKIYIIIYFKEEKADVMLQNAKGMATMVRDWPELVGNSDSDGLPFSGF